jgi:hypothetical protein
MSYSYLIDLYRALEARLEQIDTLINASGASEKAASYQRGRRDCLQDFYSFLQGSYDSKLPRRLQQKRRQA